jgi:hypothetical protein
MALLKYVDQLFNANASCTDIKMEDVTNMMLSSESAKWRHALKPIDRSDWLYLSDEIIVDWCGTTYSPDNMRKYKNKIQSQYVEHVDYMRVDIAHNLTAAYMKTYKGDMRSFMKRSHIIITGDMLMNLLMMSNRPRSRSIRRYFLEMANVAIVYEMCLSRMLTMDTHAKLAHNASEMRNITILSMRCEMQQVIIDRLYKHKCAPSVILREAAPIRAELSIKSFLDDNDIKYMSHNLLIPNSSLRYRPDFILKGCDSIVILEVDEHHHVTYNRQDELLRMGSIAKHYSKPVVFIRFNPDEYIDNIGQCVNTCLKSRKPNLLAIVRQCVKKVVTHDSVIHIYYNGYSGKSCVYRLISDDQPYIVDTDEYI